MQPSDVLKVKLNVKQYTANLKEILSKAAKDQSSSKSQELEVNSFGNWGSEAEVVSKLTVAKWSVGQLKELTRNQQALVKSKSHQEEKLHNRDLASSSYRSKYRANETALRLNSRKSTPIGSGVDDMPLDEFEDQAFSVKKISFHHGREVPSESMIKSKTKDNFFTPKIRDEMEQHPTTQTKIRGRSTNKIDRQPKHQEKNVVKHDDQVVQQLKQRISKLTKSRDQVQAELQEYKRALVKVAEQCKQLSNEVEQSKLEKRVMVLLREELTVERTNTRETLWQLRIEQQKMLQLKTQLLRFHQLQQENNRSMLSHINRLEYENRRLRTMLRIAQDPDGGSSIQSTLPKDEVQEELKKLSLFWQTDDKKLDPRDYLLRKLDELKGTASRPQPPKEQKKTFNFKVCMLPTNTREQDRDIYQDQAFIKQLGGSASRTDQPPNN